MPSIGCSRVQSLVQCLAQFLLDSVALGCLLIKDQEEEEDDEVKLKPLF